MRGVVAMADDEPKPKDSEDVINLVALRTETKIQKKRIRFSFCGLDSGCVRAAGFAIVPHSFPRFVAPYIKQKTDARW